MNKTPCILGLAAGIFSIFLWLVFRFVNPYAGPPALSPIVIMFLMLVLPACLAIFAAIQAKKLFMIMAFVWSLPYSLYCAMTPGIFALYGLSCLAYLVSFILMNLERERLKV